MAPTSRTGRDPSAQPVRRDYTHSMVPGGLEVMS
jgi:hypothetical protein